MWHATSQCGFRICCLHLIMEHRYKTDFFSSNTKSHLKYLCNVVYCCVVLCGGLLLIYISSDRCQVGGNHVMTMETSNQSNRARELFSPFLWNIYEQKVHRMNESYLRLLWNSLNEFHLIVYTFFDLNVACVVCFFLHLLGSAGARNIAFILY